MADEIDYSNTGQVVDSEEGEGVEQSAFYEPTENDKKLVKFIVDHTDRWREYRDQNFMDDWLKYERTWRGQWSENEKTRQSERSKVVSPATQQAIETRHAEIMEAVFGQGEFFDIVDDVADQNGNLDVAEMKKRLMEDFKRDKIRKSIDSIALMGEVYGTLIGEVIVRKQKEYMPMQVPISPTETAYGSGERERISVSIAPINPKNFLWDPAGTDVDDCMGVAVEKPVSIHKIVKGIADGSYLNVDIDTMRPEDELQATQEDMSYEDDQVVLLTYHGLVPRELLTGQEEVVELFEDSFEEYTDMVEAIVVIANGEMLLKKTESPYTMKDRCILVAQADTVPNRLMGRGTAEKAMNMQAAVDGSMRSHMDSLALTTAPMMGMDVTRLPRGFKFEVKPGKNILTNGNPNEILFPFKFGQTDGMSMTTSKEFERMLLMATGTIDSAGQPSQVARDNNMDMATATMIKKYKRTLLNFQEDFLIPFIYKAAWRYMQFAPDRYPSVDVKFVPTGALGIIAREFEQKQLAFLIQTLGAQSPLTPILMQGVIKNSSLTDREQMIQQMQQMSQPNPQQQQMQEMAFKLEAAMKEADVQKRQAEIQKIVEEARNLAVKTQLAPQETQAKVISALSNNLNEDAEDKDFEKRAKIADLMLKEADIASNERIARMQVASKGVQ